MDGCVCSWQSNTPKRISSNIFVYLAVAALLLLVSNVNGVSTTTLSTELTTQLPTTRPPSNPGQNLDDLFADLAYLPYYVLPQSRLEFSWRNGTVCRATPEERYTFKVGNQVENIKRKLEGCSVIEGNLELKWMFSHVSPQNYSNVQFPKLIEITGYLLLYRVNGLHTIGQLFPNLRVIRAKEVFWDYGLVLYENEDLTSISLPNLSHLGSNVVAMMNPQLCYIDDHVSWRYITPRGTPPTTNNNRKKNGCDLVDGCPEKCAGGHCWDMDTCQRICKCPQVGEHNPGCDAEGNCCHRQCLGGCTQSGSARHCYACKHIYHDGECMDKCPNVEGEMQLLEFEDRHCVTRNECITEYRFNKFHNGKCVRECPTQWVANKNLTENSPDDDYDVRVCQRCVGICDHVCGGGTIQTASESERFSGCTVIQGFLEIVLSNAPGDLSLLEEHLQYISEVTRYVKIVRSPYLKDINFLQRLKYVRGEQLDGGKYAFYVMDNENMENIWDMESHPSLIIDEGMMFFQQNQQLCYSKIEQLLDTTRFNGETTLRNGTMQKITNATHDEFDVSDTNNGQYGNCFNNSLFFNVTYQVDYFPTYNFSEFNTTDDRLIISYVLYYRIVEEDENATYYRSSCQSDEPEWITEEIEKNEKDEEEDYYNGFLPNLSAFTRYAAYVQTFTTKAVGMDGARSKIIYFTTKPSKPDRPRELVVTPLGVEVGNIGLEVTWLKPESPNGIIENYNIYYRAIPWKLEHVQRKNHCVHGVKAELTEGEPEVDATEAVQTPANSSGTCDCVTNGPPVDSDVAKEQARKREMAELRYNFENYLQNKVFEKNPNMTGKSSSSPPRVKRGVDSSMLVDEAIVKDVTTTTIMTTLSAFPLSSTTTVQPLSNETTKPTGDDNQIPSMVSVKANSSSVFIFDLEPNTEYSIEVVACHGYDKQRNVTRCSKRAMATATTKSDPSLDVIDSKSFHIMEIKNAKGDVTQLNFTWTPPLKTNGPILTYTVSYRATKDGEQSGRNNNTNSEHSFCIQSKEFTKENNSYLWDTSHLQAGAIYEFKVRMRTVGTLVGEYTEGRLAKIGDRPLFGSPAGLEVTVKVVPACVGILAAVAIVITILVYRHKRKKPLPLTTLHNSFNIDYVDTENIYIPDEWELDRAKVKIGISLGQGSFGMVYEGDARDLFNTDKKSRKVAIKTVNDTATIQDRINFLNEASRMKAFNCHHIVHLLGVVSQGQPALVIMELMALGDLKNYLRMHRPDEPDNDGRRPPTLREILQMAAEIADGMAYLSDRKFVHRDLAARNCMVAHDMTVKIGDFGMTRDVYGADYYRKGGKGMLPVRWMAPESLRDGVYTSKSDVWSYGVVLWEMATLAAQPYQGFSNEEVLKFVMDSRVMEMPDGCPKRLFEMMSQCWQYYPRYRPSFAGLLESLQGDVKKTFFGVSWYYSQRDDDESDIESDSLNIDDQRSESQPLHPSSIRSSSSDQNMADQDSDDANDDIESGLANVKGMMIDLTPPVPARMGHRAASSELYEMDSNALTNGHLTASEYDETGDEYDSLCASPILTNGISHLEPHMNCESRSKAASSIISSGQPPPSYNTATQNQPMVTDSSIWSADVGAKTNSCNGSANGHIHNYGNNLTTSAC